MSGDGGGQSVRKGRPRKQGGTRPTKDRIFDAAVGLFARDGYERTTMRRIADAVGLSESAVYRHYEGKEALLEAILAYAEEKAFAPLPVPPPSQQGVSIFRSLLLAPLAAMRDDPYLGRIMKIMYARMLHDEGLRDYFKREYVERADRLLEDLFKKEIDGGALRRCDARGLAMVFNAFRSDWAFRSFALAKDGELDSERLAEELEPALAMLESAFGAGD